MTVSRHFLGWDKPLLQSAAKIISAQYRRAEFVDCSGLTVVVPGARAGRRLLELLVRHAEAEGHYLLSPTIVTLGAFPELCYRPSLPLANESDRLIAWTTALTRSAPNTLQAVFKNWKISTFSQRLALARYLDQILSELSANLHSFQTISEVAREFGDEERWQALANIHNNYSKFLAAQGLSDKHSARLHAIESNALAFSGHVALLGTADASKLLEKILLSVQAKCSAFIFAPQDYQDYFDEIGVLKYDKWCSARVKIPDGQISICRNPSEQADAVIWQLGKSPNKLDDICIGAPNSEVLPYIKERLEEYGVSGHVSSGRPLLETSPGKLFTLTQRLLSSRSFNDFNSFVRHPQILKAITAELKLSPLSVLTALDTYQSQHLQQSAFPRGHEFPPACPDAVTRLLSWAKSKLSALLCDNATLLEWTSALHAFLVSLAWSEQGDTAALDSLTQVCTETLSCCAASKDHTCADALEFIAIQLRQCAIEDQTASQTIEILGWLELQLDDAPTLIVTGFNEGFVPESVTADILLPDTLREKAGLLSNARRLGRDIFILQSMLNSRQNLQLVCGRESVGGDPLGMSRLLCLAEPAHIPQRVLRFYSGSSELRLAPKANKLQSLWTFPSAPARLDEAPRFASVSAFKTYIDCKYRFYLAQILKLRELHDQEIELNALSFGNLTHEVLLRFGRSPVAKSADASAISESLLHILDQVINEQFGTSPYPAVFVQQEILRSRLIHFAEQQAAWRAQGWQIHALEMPLPETSSLPLEDGTAFTLRGRVDRIDFNPKSGQYAIIDYKAGDNAYSKSQVLSRKGWKDPQLPLYWHALKETLPPERTELVYVSLSAEEDKAAFLSLALKPEEMQQAIVEATRVAQAIYNQDFWPPKQPYSGPDTFKLICQDGAINP